MKKVLLITIVVLLSGCAGIRYCNPNENPANAKCHPWTTADKNQGAQR